MSPDVLVTGAQGLLGGAMVRALRKQGFDVLATGRRGLRDGTAADGYRECDLADAPSVERLFAAGPKAVIHAAGRIQGSGYAPFARDNVLATATVVDASRAAGARTCVIISSIAVYSGDGPFTEDSPAAARDPYGWSKRAAERVGLAGYDRAVVLRLGGLHGRQRTGGVVDTFFTRAVRGETIEVDEPDTRVTLTFIDDVVAAVSQLLRAENAPPSRIYNLATREAPSYGELAESVRSIVSSSSAIRAARSPKRRNRVLDTELIRSEMKFASLPLEEHLGRFARAVGSSRV